MNRKVQILAAVLIAIAFQTKLTYSQNAKCLDGLEIKTWLYAIKGTDSLYLDTYIDPRIEVKGKRPVLIFSFGGGWEGGTRKDVANDLFPFLPNMARMGYLAVGIDYRLSFLKAREEGITADVSVVETILKERLTDKGIFEYVHSAIMDGAEDLYDATSFIVKNADKWNADPECIVISGSSAGAINTFTAEYLCCNEDDLARERLPEGFKYAAIINGAGGIWKYGTDEPEWKNPPCPMLMFHGSKDNLVPYDEKLYPKDNVGLFGSNSIAEQLNKMEVPYWLYTGVGADHSLAALPFGINQMEIQSFLERVLIHQQKIALKTEESYWSNPGTRLWMIDVLGKERVENITSLGARNK